MTEAEYVDWQHSPEGREAERQAVLQSRKKPILAVETAITPTESVQITKATGARLHMKGGFTQTPNDPAVIQGIIERAAQKETEAISLRLPVADLDAAKRLAAQTGLGYQTILKDLIHEGLKRVS